MTPKVNYRRLAFEAYAPHCVHCGFGIIDVLEIAHLDCDRSNNDLKNLAILCPNCHKMHDIGLIPTDVVTRMRDEKLKANWKIRMKNAGVDAAKTRKENALKKKLSAQAQRAWETRRNGKTPDA